MKAPTVAAGPITPRVLADECTAIIGRVCKCESFWWSHDGPMTFSELRDVSAEFLLMFHSLAKSAQVDGDAA